MTTTDDLTQNLSWTVLPRTSVEEMDDQLRTAYEERQAQDRVEERANREQAHANLIARVSALPEPAERRRVREALGVSVADVARYVGADVPVPVHDDDEILQAVTEWEDLPSVSMRGPDWIQPLWRYLDALAEMHEGHAPADWPVRGRRTPDPWVAS
jgi:hypothetical protein